MPGGEVAINLSGEMGFLCGRVHWSLDGYVWVQIRIAEANKKEVSLPCQQID